MEKNKNRLFLIDDAFSKLENQKDRFLACERVYNATYDDAHRRRLAPQRSNIVERSRIYIPLAKTSIDILHSIFKSSFLGSGCPIEITRIGYNDDHDRALRDALTAAVKAKWRENKHFIGISRAVLSALYLPLGVVSVYWGDGDIQTKFIPINTIAFDPYASDINDVEYICYKFAKSRNDVRAKFKSGFYKSPNEYAVLKSSRRILIKEIYEKNWIKGGWDLTSYANDIEVRKAWFESLPFCYGYCFENMPSVGRDDLLSDDYIGVYGSCLPERVKELQQEYNIKRNQKIDLIENAIDPQFAINSEGGIVNANDLLSRKKVIRCNLSGDGDISKVVAPLMPTGSVYDVTTEIEMIKAEYEIASGVNSIMTGVTSASDRRSNTSLQTINAASGVRVESMFQSLAATMLHEYAKKYVKLLYKNLDDEYLIKITENPDIINIIGSKEDRVNKDIDFDINVNFGTTISTDVVVSKINTLLGSLAQLGLNNPNLIMPLIKEMSVALLGENAPVHLIDEAFKQMQAQQELAMAKDAMDAQRQSDDIASQSDPDKEAIIAGII
ncbi:hypothetical protein [Campylobacter sp.]|uniref:portal protein n=1 Tax=Campylobacter sp. TaxID=205 RepID=UPI00259CCAF4|nr:hypothetical protein [Campylobacter sp.]MBQ7134728.1 hypothetical protein [Campylobacter sp.]